MMSPPNETQNLKTEEPLAQNAASEILESLDAPENAELISASEVLARTADEVDLPYVPDEDAEKETSNSDSGLFYGHLGGIVRRLKRVPPNVFVRNNSNEEILVVVSDYRPTRLPTGVTANAGATSGGLGITSTVYTLASKAKVIEPKSKNPTRSFDVKYKRGYALVSIYQGHKREFCRVENDKIPLGGLAIFHGTSQLTIKDFEGNVITPRSYHGDR